MGLVYYSISWTVLAYLFFDNPEVIAIGIFAMSYGDGFASLIGKRYGKTKYIFFGDEKSYVGSFTMVIITFFMMIISLIYYSKSFTIITILILAIISIIAAIIEGITPKGLDNLSVPLIISILYWIFLIM